VVWAHNYKSEGSVLRRKKVSCNVNLDVPENYAYPQLDGHASMAHPTFL
jgi:hypothetical protein